MKGFGMILLLGGIVCAGLGIYGMYNYSQLASESVMGLSADEALALLRAFGGDAYMSSSDKLMMFTIDNRMVLLIGGIVAAIAGFFLKRSAD